MKRNSILSLLSLVLAIVLCTTNARADIVSIGEFVGQFSEGFESFPNYSNGGRYSTLAIAGGTLESIPLPPEQIRIFEPNAGATWGLGDYGSAIPHSGEKGLGVQMDDLSNPTIAFNLDSPAREFGFYYATATNSQFPPDLRVSFFDDQGNQLGTDQILDSGGNAMLWAGWSSQTGISRVVFTDNVAPVFDDFQINPIPEPSSTALLGVCLIGAGMRRRRS